MHIEETVLVGCEILCIGEQGTDLIACPLAVEEQLVCKQQKQYSAGREYERTELIDFILDRRWYPEHWHYAEGIDFRTIGSSELWQKLKELGVTGLLEFLKRQE